MALRVGLIGPGFEAFGFGWVYLCALSGVCGSDLAETGCGRPWLGGWSLCLGNWVEVLVRHLRWAINNQLRTGADKGTPTV